MTEPRAVVVHERFTEVGGSERVVEQLVRTFPDSSVFVPVADSDPERRPELGDTPVRTSGLQRLYRGGGTYAHLLPLLPLAMARADLGHPDVVITSHHAFSQRVRPADSVAMVSYVHTPARWIWEPGMRAGEIGGRLGALGLGAFAASQRRPDRRAAGRPDRILANSAAVADRIRRWWDRESTVVHPPVRTHYFTPDPDMPREDFFLLAGRLVPYKRPEVAVDAARRAGVRLIVAGEGRAREACEAVSGPGVEFLGRVEDDEMRDLMRRARALVFPGEDDFGIIPVEAMACGTPAIALGAGGALDTVVEGETGVLVEPDTSGSAPVARADRFEDALRNFNDSAYDPVSIRARVEVFAEDRFRTQMHDVVTATLRG